MKAEDLLGRAIAGYRLLEMVERGGMSIVYLARSLEHPEDSVAIKILLPSNIAMADEFVSFQARFLREAQAAHRLQHRHILPVLGYGEEDGLFYMVMPFISGGSLARRLAAEQEPVPLREIASYLNQLASAVDYANHRGMVHRDIKPGNVLIDEQDNVYLADFGIVHLFESRPLAVDQAPTTLTTTGKMYGTPAYMAPERFKGEPAEPATDIYALGVLLYQLVTGQVPFTAGNPLTLGMKHLTEEPPRPRSLRPDLPEPAEAAILKALAKQPADRFATASRLATAFEAGLKGQWVEDVLPLPAIFAASLVETQVQQPVVPIPTNTHQPDRLVLGPAPEAPGSSVPLAFAPTSANAPAIALPGSRPRNYLRMVALAALVVVLLLFAGLLGFAVYRGVPPQAPDSGTTPVPAGTKAPPTRAAATPTPSAGATLTTSPANSPTHTATPSPTPKPSPKPSSTPSPTPTPSPSPTLAASPTPTLTPTPRKTP